MLLIGALHAPKCMAHQRTAERHFRKEPFQRSFGASSQHKRTTARAIKSSEISLSLLSPSLRVVTNNTFLDCYGHIVRVQRLSHDYFYWN